MDLNLTPEPQMNKTETPVKAANQIKHNPAPPYEGFGPLWRKTFRVALNGTDLSPVEIMRQWKDNFSRFWPSGNNFYDPLPGISAGDVALITSDATPGLELSTGVIVTQSDATSFTILTAKGHIFAGTVHFKVYQATNGKFAQVQLLARSADPVIELGMLVIGHDLEDRFWLQTLTNLARYFNSTARVQFSSVCADPGLQWRKLENISYNPFLRAAIDLVEDPGSLLRR